MKSLSLSVLATLFLLALFLTGCPMLQKETQVTASDGHALYWGADGKATSDAVDPKTGKPNDQMTRKESNGTIEAATQAGSSIPGPVGAVIGLVGSLGGAAFAAYLARKNAATNAALAEYESKISAKPEARKAVDDHVWDGLSPNVQAKLANL